MQSTSVLSLGAIVASLAGPSLAAGPSGEATQVNYYTDGKCSNFAGHFYAYYGKSPKVGTTQDGAAAECIALNLSDNIKSLNTVSAFLQTGNAVTTQGHCTFYSDYGCAGKQEIQRSHWPGNGQPGCLNARGNLGYLWKSAKCFIDN